MAQKQTQKEADKPKLTSIEEAPSFNDLPEAIQVHLLREWEMFSYQDKMSKIQTSKTVSTAPKRGERRAVNKELRSHEEREEAVASNRKKSQKWIKQHLQLKAKKQRISEEISKIAKPYNDEIKKYRDAANLVEKQIRVEVEQLTGNPIVPASEVEEGTAEKVEEYKEWAKNQRKRLNL